MNVFETLSYTGERVQIPLAIGSVDPSGEMKLLYVNSPCAIMFGYPSPSALIGLSVESLMPEAISRGHKAGVSDYLRRANGGTKRVGGVMDKWRDLDGVRRDGSLVPLSINVADIRNKDERYFLALFYDRTSDVAEEANRRADREREMATLERAKLDAEALREQAENARRLAEDGLLKQQRLTGQITLLRQIFGGTLGLVVLLAVLVVAQWSTGGTGEGLSMVKDILLVLTGILGSAMASVFDSRNGRNNPE
jgi:PAS domain S-box-containing protein